MAPATMAMRTNAPLRLDLLDFNGWPLPRHRGHALRRGRPSRPARSPAGPCSDHLDAIDQTGGHQNGGSEQQSFELPSSGSRYKLVQPRSRRPFLRAPRPRGHRPISPLPMLHSPQHIRRAIRVAISGAVVACGRSPCHPPQRSTVGAARSSHAGRAGVRCRGLVLPGSTQSSSRSRRSSAGSPNSQAPDSLSRTRRIFYQQLNGYRKLR